MSSRLQGLSSGSAHLGVIALGLFSASYQATAAQFISSEDCSFDMHVPGVFGRTNLHLKMQKGSIFTEDGSHKFCGPVRQATPLGESIGNQCFVITDGKLISGKWSNKVTSSNCVLTNAAAMHTPFVVGDLAPWAKGGAASLHGQAFLKTVSGDVKTCASGQVLLLPATAYVDELLAKKKVGISGFGSAPAVLYPNNHLRRPGQLFVHGTPGAAMVCTDKRHVGSTAHWRTQRAAGDESARRRTHASGDANSW